MSWTGLGAVAIWNDVASGGRDNFYAWHGREHIPERVGIPGFLDGRRYVGVAETDGFFTLYLTETPSVFRGAEYAERLNSPTPWTLRSTAEFRNVARALCVVKGSEGSHLGGLLATWRCDPADEAALTKRVSAAIPDIAERDGVCAVHLLAADIAASGVDNEERRRRGDPNAVPPITLIVESWGDEAPFADLCRDLDDALFTNADREGMQRGVYRLQSALTKSDLTG